MSRTIPILSGYAMSTPTNAPNTIVERDSQGNINVTTVTTSTLALSGGVTYAVQDITTSTVLDGTAMYVLADATSGAITATLPAVAFPSGNTGRLIVIKKIDNSTNAVTINVPDAALIDGQATKVLKTQYEAAALISDGSSWFTVGSVPLRTVNDPVSLTFSTNLNTDASQGNTFKFTATANFTLNAPTNAVDGQKLLWRIQQDSTGNRVITLGSGFNLGTDIGSVVLSTVANKTDYLGAIYNAASGKWNVVTLVRGYA